MFGEALPPGTLPTNLYDTSVRPSTQLVHDLHLEQFVRGPIGSHSFAPDCLIATCLATRAGWSRLPGCEGERGVLILHWLQDPDSSQFAWLAIDSIIVVQSLSPLSSQEIQAAESQ